MYLLDGHCLSFFLSVSFFSSVAPLTPYLKTGFAWDILCPLYNKLPSNPLTPHFPYLSIVKITNVQSTTRPTPRVRRASKARDRERDAERRGAALGRRNEDAVQDVIFLFLCALLL
jgi:hypothetical protein